MKFTFDEYAEQLRKDGRLVGEAVEVIRRTVKLHGPRLVQAEIQSVTPHQPVDRATYKRSFRFDDIPGGAVMYNFAPHASIVELGRRPGGRMPPLSVIEDWVRRKGIGLRSGPAKKGSKFQRRTEAELRGIAFVIARQIRSRGLPAHHIIRLASQKLEKVIGQELAKLGTEGAESRE
jgi:hypothetical protein